MYSIISRILLIALCAAIGLKSPGAYELTPLLIAIAISLICGVMQKRSAVFFLCIAYVLMSFITPFKGFPYIPVVVYEITSSLFYENSPRFKLDAAFLPLLAGIIITIYSGQEVLPLCLCSALAVFMANTVERLNILELKTLGDADDKRQLEKLMKDRIKDAKEKQDNEVHLATLTERNRIARDIHDNVGHLLSRALLMMGAIKAINTDSDLKEHLDVLNQTLSDAMDSCRVSVHDLYDESIDLKENLNALVRDFTFCPVTLEYSCGPKISKEVKYCIAGIVKEALSNIAKHSNATGAKVVFMEHESIYQLLIEDNGSVSINSDGTGIGLNNMQDRVNALKGTFYLRKENGYRILVTIPRPKQEG